MRLHTVLKSCATAALLVAAAAAGALLSARVVRADDGIPIYTASAISTFTASTVTVEKPGSVPRSRGGKTKPVKLSFFFGSWKTFVPGASYVTPDQPGSGTGTIHTSPGALGTTLVIRGDRRWAWKGRVGTWKPTGDADYPLELLNAVDGHDWRVGVDVHHPKRIFVWDGSTWYGAKR